MYPMLDLVNNRARLSSNDEVTEAALAVDIIGLKPDQIIGVKLFRPNPKGPFGWRGSATRNYPCSALLLQGSFVTPWQAGDGSYDRACHYAFEPLLSSSFNLPTYTHSRLGASSDASYSLHQPSYTARKTKTVVQNGKLCVVDPEGQDVWTLDWTGCGMTDLAGIHGSQGEAARAHEDA